MLTKSHGSAGLHVRDHLAVSRGKEHCILKTPTLIRHKQPQDDHNQSISVSSRLTQ